MVSKINENSTRNPQRQHKRQYSTMRMKMQIRMKGEREICKASQGKARQEKGRTLHTLTDNEITFYIYVLYMEYFNFIFRLQLEHFCILSGNTLLKSLANFFLLSKHYDKVKLPLHFCAEQVIMVREWAKERSTMDHGESLA